MVDDAVFALGAAERKHLRDDFGNRVGFGTDGAGAGDAAERAHADLHHLAALAGEQFAFGMNQDDGAVADDDGALAGEVERNDGDFFGVDVKPDVELGPIGELDNADALALLDAGIENVPELGALIFGVPLAERIAERVDAFLGARFFFVAA